MTQAKVTHDHHHSNCLNHSSKKNITLHGKRQQKKYYAGKMLCGEAGYY